MSAGDTLEMRSHTITQSMHRCIAVDSLTCLKVVDLKQQRSELEQALGRERAQACDSYRVHSWVLYGC